MAVNTFPRLQTLDAVIKSASSRALDPLRDVAMVSCQHLLETTGSLFECLFDNGLNPRKTFILGKVYSTNDGVAEALRRFGCDVVSGARAVLPGAHGDTISAEAASLWKRAETVVREEKVRGVIVIDDGAHLHRAAPLTMSDYQQSGKIIGVEQTTSGLMIDTLYPIINVASSAIKRHFEPALVCRAVLARVKKLMALHHRNSSCGIIGLGKIGATLAEALRNDGYNVYGFDVDRQRLASIPRSDRCKSAMDLVVKSDIIFGCTGRDSVPTNDEFADVVGRKTFVSCSSSDIEFRSLLREHWSWISETRKDQCPTLKARHPKGKWSLRVLRSGYPVNFDNTRESVPLEEIQVTRGLLLGATLQALELIGQKRARGSAMIMLDPKLQHVILNAWRSSATCNTDPDEKWIQRESRGALVPCHVLSS